jgi:HPt (histidine-containing phosphotransfer) domain-containing protein
MDPADGSPIDWGQFTKQFDGDPEFIESLRETFLEHLDLQIWQLGKAVADGDAEAIEKAAHAIKGAVAQVFAESARQLAGEIEARARAGSIDGIEVDAEQLGRQLDLVKVAIIATRGD